METLHDLVGYKNRKIYQNTDWFSFSLDSVLLANFVNINPRDKKILDIGTGTAPIPLILSTKTDKKILGVEIQKDVATLAKKSVEYNKLGNQIEILNLDAKKLVDIYKSDYFDVIISNPPYFRIEEGSYLNEDEHKVIARHEVFLDLNNLLKISRAILKNNGSLSIVYRTDRFIEVITEFKKNNIEPKRVQFIYPKIGSSSNLFMLEGKKNGKTGLEILSPLYVHEKNGDYTTEIKEMFE